MKIVCYCQHVLGIGHFHRSLEICKALAYQHEIVMVLGGPPVTLPSDTGIRFLQLPGLKMDAHFSALEPCDSGLSLKAVKQARQERLLALFGTFKPDIFLVELYPFGRKAFSFELDPILEGIHNGTLAPCRRLCSLRDILVEKRDPQKYETRVLTRLNNFFDGLLIHSDPSFIPLSQTFSRCNAITIPFQYTGFISPALPTAVQGANALRQRLSLTRDDKLIVASIGGGNVGAELLIACAKAARLLVHEPNVFHFHLFSGPYSDPELRKKLLALSGPNLHLHSFSSHFQEWLQAADLSISMAGYNTCMNLLKSGVPALLYPFAQNREQTLRIQAFSKDSPFQMLTPEELSPPLLADAIRVHLQQERMVSGALLNGAEQSCTLISNPHQWIS